jgi:ferredoxin--NADP+ reductase
MRAVGYRGSAPDGLPFDEGSYTVPSRDSRVLRDGRAEPGEYVVGWIKRGATGVIGTNRSDAKDTVASLRTDVPALLAARAQDPGGIAALLDERGVDYVDVAGWRAVVEAENREGSAHGRGAVKISDWHALLEAARSARPA